MDVNGDGKPELVVGDAYGNSVLEFQYETGAPATELTLAGQSGGLTLSLGGNGVPNLIGGSASNVVDAGVAGRSSPAAARRRVSTTFPQTTAALAVAVATSFNLRPTFQP